MRGKRWSEQYHTVGIHWIDERNIQFYLNGEKAGSVVTEKDFTKKLHVIWDVWTSYDWCVITSYSIHYTKLYEAQR